MTRVVVSVFADADAANILDYLASKASLATAIKYNALFEGLYDRLTVYPDSGSPRPALGPTIRIGVVPPYIVIYDHEPAAGRVTILRIVHGRRGITGTMLSSSRK